jgi:hypothetical protein
MHLTPLVVSFVIHLTPLGEPISKLRDLILLFVHVSLQYSSSRLAVSLIVAESKHCGVLHLAH